MLSVNGVKLCFESKDDVTTYRIGYYCSDLFEIGDEPLFRIYGPSNNKLGLLESLIVRDRLGEQMAGNLYIRKQLGATKHGVLRLFSSRVFWSNLDRAALAEVEQPMELQALSLLSGLILSYNYLPSIMAYPVALESTEPPNYSVDTLPAVKMGINRIVTPMVELGGENRVLRIRKVFQGRITYEPSFTEVLANFYRGRLVAVHKPTDALALLEEKCVRAVLRDETFEADQEYWTDIQKYHFEYFSVFRAVFDELEGEL